ETVKQAFQRIAGEYQLETLSRFSGEILQTRPNGGADVSDLPRHWQSVPRDTAARLWTPRLSRLAERFPPESPCVASAPPGAPRSRQTGPLSRDVGSNLPPSWPRRRLSPTRLRSRASRCPPSAGCL